MEGKDNWGKPSIQKRPSVKKCGLKTKINIPKGGPAKKPFGTPSLTNPGESELSKVFASRNKKGHQETEVSGQSSTFPMEKASIGKLINNFQGDKFETVREKPCVESLPKTKSLGNVLNSAGNWKKTAVSCQQNNTRSSEPPSKPVLSKKPVITTATKLLKGGANNSISENSDVQDRKTDNTPSSQPKPVVKAKLSAAILKFENNPSCLNYNKAPAPPSGKKLQTSRCKASELSPSSPRKRSTQTGSEVDIKTALRTENLNSVLETDSSSENKQHTSSCDKLNCNTQNIGMSEQGKLKSSPKLTNKAPPSPRKALPGGGVKSDKVAQVINDMCTAAAHNSADKETKLNKTFSSQVVKNRAAPPPRKQRSESQDSKDVGLKCDEVVTKDNNFNNVQDVRVACSAVSADSDEWSSEQEESSRKYKLRSRQSSSSKKRRSSSRRKLKKSSPHHKSVTASGIDTYSSGDEVERVIAEQEWETEDEERVDSGGYEIVERGPDGRLIFRTVSHNKQTSSGACKLSREVEVKVVTNGGQSKVTEEESSRVTTEKALKWNNNNSTTENTRNQETRRMDFIRTSADWDSDYVGPDPESDSYTEFDPISPPEKAYNSLPVPPRSRPETLTCGATSTPNTLEKPAAKHSPSCRSPLSQQVQPPPLEPVPTRHRSSPQGSPSQARRPPPLPSKESISRLSQVSEEKQPVPPERKKRSLDYGTSTEDEGLPPVLTPRSNTASSTLDDQPPPLPPRRMSSPFGPDSDIPDMLPPPPPPPSARTLTVPGVTGRSRDKSPGRSMDKSPLHRPPAPLPPEHSTESHSASDRKKVNLSVLVPLPSQDKADEGYLKPDSSTNSKGYLEMNKQRAKGTSYIDPLTDLASVPNHCPSSLPAPQLVISTDSQITDTEVTSPSVHNYLKLVDDDFISDVSPTSTLLEDSGLFNMEPLYQIYHRGAVLRDVLDNDGDYAFEKKDSNDIYCDAAVARDYASGILSRINSVDSMKSSVKSDCPSSLEFIVETGTAVRTLWSEMEVVQSCEAASAMKLEERKIQEALFEIITSEASYLKSLDLLVSHFVNSPMLDYHCIHKATISKRENQVLFSNIRKVRDVSRSFLKELEKLWRKNCILNAEEVCDIIARYAANKFDVYVKYCSNQTFQLRELDRLRDKNTGFNYQLQMLDHDPVCQGQNIQSFLTLPMQRVTRLPLLVDAVCHRLDPTHQEVYTKVTHALNTLQKLVKECNEGARQMNNIEEVNMIDRMLDFKHTKKIAIVSQSRSIVKKGPLVQLLPPSGLFFKKKTQTLDLFLFNDVLIITKKKGDQNYLVENYSPRISVHADLLTEPQMQKLLPGGPSGHLHMFLLVLLEKKQEYVFSCESMSECARWVEAIEPAQSLNENERIYEEWDCPQVQAVHSYMAREHDELSLEESDVINVFKKMADGWYEGERIRDGIRGWFPSDHVVEIQSQHVRAKNLRQQYRMLQMSNQQLANMLENPVKTWKEIDAMS